MLLVNLERGNGVPVYRQILEGVVRLVDDEALAPGDRLPPTRTLARNIGVHRSTVLRAYEELWALGYLESRPGSYSTVRRPTRRARQTEATAQTLIDWDAEATPNGLAASESARLLDSQPPAPGVVDFSRLKADRNLAPVDGLRRSLRSVLLSEGSQILDYGDAAGYRPLRQSIARRMRVHGVEVSADEVVITGGAQQAIDLVLHAFVGPGQRIATESPTYATALPLFRLHGLETLEIPMAADGIDLEALERAFTDQRPGLLYTIPNFHNPTGISTSQAHRERLLALCERYQVPILEDGFEEEMKYFGKAVLPIKSMDAKGVVLYVGTFSKVVFPGLRVGWIAAPHRCCQLLEGIQRSCCLSGNILTQAAVQRFCDSGLYEAHLRRIHKTYRKRMSAMLRGLETHVARRGVRWTEPQGGYSLWLEVRSTRLDEATLAGRLLDNGVKVSAGSLYFSRPPKAPHFRLSVACLSEAEILEGCRRLGRTLEAALAG